MLSILWIRRQCVKPLQKSFRLFHRNIILCETLWLTNPSPSGKMAGMMNLSHTPGVGSCICNFSLSLFDNQLIVLYQSVLFVQNSLSIVTQRINNVLPFPFGKYNLLSEISPDWTKTKELRKNRVGSEVPGSFVKTRRPRPRILCSTRHGHSPSIQKSVEWKRNGWNG